MFLNVFQITADVLNVGICDVMTSFLLLPDVKVKFMTEISEYLLSLLRKKYAPQQTGTLLKILKRLFYWYSDSGTSILFAISTSLLLGLLDKALSIWSPTAIDDQLVSYS